MFLFCIFVEFFDDTVKLGDYFTSLSAGVLHGHGGEVVEKGV